MPIERDDEATSFDARPWGGQQRLIPLANRFARGTDAPPAPVPTPAPLPRKPRTQPARLAPTSVFVAPAALLAASTNPADAETILQRPTQESLPVPRVAPHEISGELESPVARISPPVDITTEPVPVLTYCAVVSAPVEPSTMPMLTPVPQPMPQLPAAAPTVSLRAAQMPAPVRHPIVAISRKHPPKAIPAFSVKHGCSLGGYVVPHLPRVAEVFRHSDSTVAVRRRPLSARSLVAVPIGAVLSVVAILTIYLAQSSASAAPKTAAVAAPAAAHVMKMTTTLEAPAPAAAPVVMPVAAPIAAAPSPAGEPVIVEVPAAVPPATVAAAEPTKSPRRARSSRHKKPRHIVAVDASTPLGNLRPGR